MDGELERKHISTPAAERYEKIQRLKAQLPPLEQEWKRTHGDVFEHFSGASSDTDSEEMREKTARAEKATAELEAVREELKQLEEAHKASIN